MSAIFLPPTALFPSELVDMIFDLTTEEDEVNDIASVVRARTSIQLLSHEFRSYVDSKPVYWNHILVDMATLGSLPLAIAKAHSLPLYITIRIPDSTSLALTDWFSVQDTVSDFLLRAKGALLPYLSRCTSIVIQCSTLPPSNRMLQALSDGHPSILNSVAVSFDFTTFTLFSSKKVYFVAFRTTPPLGHVFVNYRRLSILPHNNPVSRCVHVSTGETSCTIYQSRDRPLKWSDVIDVLDPGGQYTHLVFRDVVFVSDAVGILSCPPFWNVTSLDVAFRGDVFMGVMVSRLNLPQLEVFVARLSHRADWDCLAMCGAFLNTVRVLQLVVEGPQVGMHGITPPSVCSRFFSVLHCVHRLNLLSADACLVAGLIIASTIPSPQSISREDNNWNACPNLRHVDFGRLGFNDLRRLLTIRREAGYPPLTSFSAFDLIGCTDIMVAEFVHLAIVLSAVPPEIWDHIFDLALGYMWRGRGPPAFDFIRRSIGHTCGSWRDVLSSNPIFWCPFNITPATDYLAVQHALLLTRGCPLTARVRFSTQAWGPQPRSVQDIVDVLARDIHRMRVLSIAFKDRAACMASYDLLSRLPFSSIRRLALTLEWTRFAAGGVGFTAISVPHPMPDLTRIYLAGFRFDFSSTQQLDSLTEVVLKHIRPVNSLPFQSFHALTVGAPRLRRLCMQNIGCQDILPQYPPICYPHVLELDLGFGSSDPTFHMLIGILRFPSIRRLRVNLRTSSDLRALNHCVGLLGNVKDFAFTGLCPSTMITADTLQLLPSLSFLELLSADAGFLIALTTANQVAGSRLCPNLWYLGISKLSPSAVRSYLSNGDPTLSSLKTVVFHRYHPDHDDNADLVWLEERVRVLRNVRFRDADWTHEYW
ncbi:hypothetical protein B0H13DRAFT_2389540 [Mycena leptocephala]|nr:hypothetical protein B0H13DRAFT_2389540 [Mycena leptocephala]